MTKPAKLPAITEDAFQTQIIAFARLFGWRVAHFRAVRVKDKNGTPQYQTPVQADGAGFPDLLLVNKRHNPPLIVAELKVGRNKATAEQQKWLAEFELAGIPAYTWNPGDWPEIEKALQ